MLQRRRVHGDQRRVNDRPGVHQRARQRIAARLDHAGKRAADHSQRMRLQRQREYARRQPLGTDGDRRLEGPMLAREPRQRAGLGERDLGAVAGIPLRPSANSIEPNVPGGRNTTWPSARCGASARAMSGCAVAGAGHTMSSAPRTASPMSAVIRRGRASCRPRKSLTVMTPPAARCASIGLAVAPPQAHLVAGKREITGRRQRAIATAQNGDFHLASAPFRARLADGPAASAP